MSDAQPEANSGGSRGQLLLDGKSDRRTFLKRSAIAGGVAMAALYVPPMFSTSGARTAYAAGTTAGGEGCTPGFWKQTQHFDDWTAPCVPDGGSPSLFNATFGTSAGSPFTNGLTLLGALWFEEDVDPNVARLLAAHATAALLNAKSSLVSFPYTPAQVKAMTLIAFTDGTSGVIETQKDEFDTLNNAGCGL